MYCTNCGKEMNDNQEVCLECGVKKGVGKSYCANCGNAVSENAAICTSCGVKLDNKANADYLNGKDKTTMALIAIFLGGLGIHNFMMGETKKGITRIVATCCCGIGYILAIIDFIKILTDSYVVDPNAMF